MNKVKRYLYELAIDKRQGPVAVGLKALLLYLSFAYGALIRALVFFRRRKRYTARCIIISIGNIVLGGTGKTPLVEYISGFLTQHNHPHVIVSRGYKRPPQKKDRVSSLPYASLGDELYMLLLNLKTVAVIADKDRVRALRRATEEYAIDTAILDDGFQQWHIQKDLEIVTINASNPFGNLRMIPRGILREPIESLARADIFMLTRVGEQLRTTSLKEHLHRINPSALVVESQYQPVGVYRITDRNTMFDAALLKGKRVTRLCAIADPASFEETMKKTGVETVLSFDFADHHSYEEKDIAGVIKASRENGIDTIVTTEKDSVRLLHLMPKYADSGVSVFVLKIRMAILENEKEFFDRLRALYPR